MKKSIQIIPPVVVIVVLGLIGVLRGAYTPSSNSDRILEDLGQAVHIVEQWDVTEADLGQVIEGAIHGMMQNLDPHSSFFNEKVFARMKEEQKGSFYGIGVGIQMINGLLTVISPVPGTPAARAGIRAGDVISAIDGEPTEGKPIEELMFKLRGPKGTRVTLTIQRPGYEEPFTVTLIRDEIPLATVTYAFMIRPEVGYIRMKSFGEKTYEELTESLKTLKKQGMKKLILDMRGNSGGLLDQAVEVIDAFLPDDMVIVSVRGRGLPQEIVYRSQEPSPYEKIPVVVLVNRGTASAAEILAGAFQDHDRALLVGEPTWGKGLVQTLYPLSFKTAVAITTAHYYTPSGRLIQRSYRSYFLYMFPDARGVTNAIDETEVYRTDLGRKVYARGGIDPDIHVEDLEWPEVVQQLYARFVFFEYAKLYAPEEARSQEQTHHSHRILLSRKFEVTDSMLKHFLQFLKQKDIPVKTEDVMKQDEWVRRALKKELLTALWGDEAGYAYIIQYDPQVQRSLEVIDDSLALWSRRLEEGKVADKDRMVSSTKNGKE